MIVLTWMQQACAPQHGTTYCCATSVYNVVAQGQMEVELLLLSAYAMFQAGFVLHYFCFVIEPE